MTIITDKELDELKERCIELIYSDEDFIAKSPEALDWLNEIGRQIPRVIAALREQRERGDFWKAEHEKTATRLHEDVLPKLYAALEKAEYHGKEAANLRNKYADMRVSYEQIINRWREELDRERETSKRLKDENDELRAGIDVQELIRENRALRRANYHMLRRGKVRSGPYLHSR